MISFENVSKSMGDKKVLDNISFQIQPQETFVIVGSSGTGKSVTLKHMVRLLTPDEGRVLVGDEVVSEAHGTKLELIRSRFGYLFQGGALLQWMTVGENICLPLRQRTQMSDADMARTAREKLKMVGLEESYFKHPSDLSGGMQKRVALARALVMSPEIILYDEPTSGLDPVTARTIDDLITNMRMKLGVTSVVVTHDLRSALAIGTRIAFLSAGHIIELSTPAEFIKSNQPEVQRFLEADYVTNPVLRNEETRQ